MYSQIAIPKALFIWWVISDPCLTSECPLLGIFTILLDASVTETVFGVFLAHVREVPHATAKLAGLLWKSVYTTQFYLP